MQRSVILTDLPDDALSIICHFLPLKDLLHVAHVCRRLQSIVYDTTVKLDMRAVSSNINHTVEMTSHFRCLTEISLRHDLTEAHVAALSRSFAHLHQLEASRCELVPSAWERLLSYCNHLRYLNIGGCSSVDNTVLYYVSRNCPQLQHLDVSYSERLTDTALTDIAACTTLVSLNVSACPYLTDGGFRVLLLRCVRLQILDVSKCNVTDKFLQLLLPKCNLQTLKLAECREITDAGIEAMSTACDRLTTLDVTACNISDYALQTIATSCKSLTNLNIGTCLSITDDGLREVALQCPKLSTVECYGCKSVTGKFVADAHELQTLNVRGCQRVGDTCLQLLATSCPQMTVLDVGGCSRLTDEGLRVLATGCPLLQVLDISHCVRVTDVGLIHIANACKHLTTMLLDGTSIGPAITDVGLHALQQGCSKLRVMA